MDFEYSEKVQGLRKRLNDFMEANIYPMEREYREYFRSTENPWTTPPLMQELKKKARAEGLWNLFYPRGHGVNDALSNLEYAPLAEIMGRVVWAAEVFNCNAPDSGNMETLILYGTDQQKERWLKPVLSGEIRSGFAMTEPGSACSDATNVSCEIRKDGDTYIINGRKWFTTGAMRDSCKILILMGKTDPGNRDRYRQQSMILVPRDTPGVKIVRHTRTFGYDDAPFGEPEILFQNVHVPAENLLLGEGHGFEIAQGRLGPGRIHHCMRLIGCAQRALELACGRVESRSTFGRKISQHQSVREDIARAFCNIEQARLLTLMAADRMDRHGNKEARDLIAAIKIVAPAMACKVIDNAIQMHGAAGLTEDVFLAEAYNYARQIRIADGPDQVHMMALGKQIIQRYS
ncbi:MAG: acyl-CoA dehydrogenase family protein [Gammaproteobacteria bacterium]|nr:acyl-CoA dehydrogenase family protein [Gammaproteobacteria bacterium]